jgi:hypothetical protein
MSVGWMAAVAFRRQNASTSIGSSSSTRAMAWSNDIASAASGASIRSRRTAGGMNNVSQQIGAALGVALISTIAASATSRYLVHHATTTTVSAHAAVHGYAVGYWWAAGLFLASALICSAIVRPHTSMIIDAAEIEAVEKAIPAI